MKDRPEDPALGALRAAAREEAGDALADPRWEALAAGEATAEERAALEALAAESKEAEGAMELFAPLGEAAEDRFAKAIEAQIALSSSSKPPVPVPEPSPPKKSGTGTGTGTGTGQSRRRWPAVASVIALAAALALFFTFRPTDEALPGFEPIFVAGYQEHRGDPEPGPIRIRPDTEIAAALRPVRAVKGAVAARVWLLRGPIAGRLPAEIEVSSDGAVRLSARLPRGKALAPGAAELVIAVCRPAELPIESETSAAVILAHADHCSLLRRPAAVEVP